MRWNWTWPTPTSASRAGRHLQGKRRSLQRMGARLMRSKRTAQPKEINAMGRPPITLRPEQVHEVETLAALLNQDQIADYFGIARNTFRAICAREPEVGERYKRGKAKAIAHVANGLLQKARAGDTTSAIFYLKTQAGWRETKVMEHGFEQCDAEPAGLDVNLLSDAALSEIIAVSDEQKRKWE